MNGTSEIKTNWEKIRKDVAQLSQGRDVRIIAVSKNRSIETLNAAYGAGIRDFGENRAQEIREKAEFFSKSGVALSFIGRLQENKIKYLLLNCSLIQSVDSLKLAAAIDEAFRKHGRRIDVLLQINSSYEESKAGFMPEDALKAWGEAMKFTGIRLCGLMTIGAHDSDERKIEKSFMIAEEIYREVSVKYGNAEILSMGMSEDYRTALRCNSNMLRIGRAVFDGSNNQ